MALAYVFGSKWLRRNGANTLDWALWALAGSGIINVISAVALLGWKRWRFWLFVAPAVGGTAVNVAIGLPQGIFGAVFGIALLYGVLHIGKEKKPGYGCSELARRLTTTFIGYGHIPGL
jgi:hypothetical protein